MRAPDGWGLCAGWNDSGQGFSCPVAVDPEKWAKIELAFRGLGALIKAVVCPPLLQSFQTRFIFSTSPTGRNRDE